MWCSIVPRDILTILFLCGCHIIVKTAAVVHTVGMFHFSGFKSRPGECRLFRMTDGDEKIGCGYFRQRERTYWCLERLELEIVPWDKTRHVPYVSNCRYNCPVTATFDCVLGSRPGPIWKPSMPSSLETAGKWILWGVHATEFCGVYLYLDWVYVQADEGWRVRGLEWETMNIFRTYSENNPNIYWTNTEHIPNIYRTYTKHIPNIYSYTEHLSVRVVSLKFVSVVLAYAGFSCFCRCAQEPSLTRLCMGDECFI